MKAEECIQAIKKGEISALAELYQMLYETVFAAALAITKSEAQANDIAQETFLRAFNRADQYRAGTNPQAWILAIARNLAYDCLRDRQKTVTRDADFFQHISGRTEEEGRVVARIDLSGALFSLSIQEREIVALKVVAGFKHKEIALLLDLPPGTVRWKYREALKKLKARMRGEQNEG